MSATVADPTPVGDSDRRNRATWLLALGGLIGGLAAFGIGEATYQAIPARRVMIDTMGTKSLAVTAATQSVANVRNGALAYAIFGGCLAGCLGIAGGLARRSVTATAAAGLLGLLLGAGLAAGLSLATLQAFADAQIRLSEYDMAISMAMHGLIWGLIGGVSGLAFGVGMGGWRRMAAAALLGIAGAVLGTIAFDLVGAAFFALAETGEPVSTSWPSRLTARMLVALATAGGVILSLPQNGGRPSPPVESGLPRTS